MSFLVSSFHRIDGRDYTSGQVKVETLEQALRLYRRMQEQPDLFIPEEASMFVVGPVYEERERRLPALVRPSVMVQRHVEPEPDLPVQVPL